MKTSIELPEYLFTKRNERLAKLELALENLRKELDLLLPETPEATQATIKLLELKFWATKTIETHCLEF